MSKSRSSKAGKTRITAFPATKPLKSGKRAAQQPAAGYIPGYFVELVIKHNFPPDFKSRLVVDRYGHLQAEASKERERQALEGSGWGTLPMARTPNFDKPGWM